MNPHGYLIKGTLLKRYKRFLCDVKLENDQIVTAHCPNSGSMLSVNIPRSTVYLSRVDSTTAKLPYRLELVEINNTLVGVNTLKANNILLEALYNKTIPELSQYNCIKKESSFDKNCRFDFMLSNSLNPVEKCFVEVKSVTLKRTEDLAEFPDSVTVRGTKHTEKLLESLQYGYKAYIVYIIQREDCNNFTIAQDIDVDYFNAIQHAMEQGVKVLCYNCNVSPEIISIKNAVNILL